MNLLHRMNFLNGVPPRSETCVIPRDLAESFFPSLLVILLNFYRFQPFVLLTPNASFATVLKMLQQIPLFFVRRCFLNLEIMCLESVKAASDVAPDLRERVEEVRVYLSRLRVSQKKGRDTKP